MGPQRVAQGSGRRTGRRRCLLRQWPLRALREDEQIGKGVVEHSLSHLRLALRPVSPYPAFYVCDESNLSQSIDEHRRRRALGDRVALGRAITLIESTRPEDQQKRARC